ncbi:MAG: hypothetical protein DRG24_02960 [Epsilonproteobacteria bacterium]|nr:MAG: hypothetical protein DRG24_02960 [Campylobacterota bacterium]
MFNDLQDQDKENARLCKQFQEKLRKAILSDDLSAASKVDGYKKRVKLYCPEETRRTSTTMFSGLQNEDAQNAHLCKSFQKKVHKLEAKAPLDDAGKKKLESYQKRVKLYCR